MKSLALFVAVIIATVCVCAAGELPEDGPMNATVLGDVNVRRDTPRITFRSLLNLKMEQALWLDVLRIDARVRVLDDRVVVGKYLWFKVAYDKGGVRRVGWVYSGRAGGGDQLVALDAGPESLRRSRSLPCVPAVAAALLSPSAAWAQDGPPVENDVESQFLSRTRVSLSGVFLLAVLVVSLCLFRWIFKGDNKYVCLFGLVTLIIFGVLSPDIIQAGLTLFPW